MKKFLTLFLLTGLLLSCKKEDQTAGFSLTGTSWEHSWYSSDNVIWFGRLDFTSENQVVFSNSFTKDKLMSATGRAVLTYTIEDISSASPKIHITGKYNNIAGEPGKGATVDYTLSYIPPSGLEEAKLSAENAGTFIKVVYK